MTADSEGTTLYYQDSEARQLRAERAAAMALRNVYNNPLRREQLPVELRLAAADLLTADGILEKAREDMIRSPPRPRR